MAKEKKTAVVRSQERLGDDIFSMWIQPGEVSQARAGQFISVYSKDGSRLLPRPISICETDPGAGQLRMVYRVVGEGTREFSACKAGDEISILGPLGNGFPDVEDHRRAFLIGGGIGIPTMLELAKGL